MRSRVIRSSTHPSLAVSILHGHRPCYGPRRMDVPPDLALRWLIDMGADEAIGESPVDRFAAPRTAETAPAADQRRAPPPPSARPAAPPRPAPPANAAMATAVAGARALA